MKRVLVLSYCFPPMPDAGALRGSFLARYLPRFGWRPTIVALDHPGQRLPEIDTLYVANPLSRSPRRGATANRAGSPAVHERADPTPPQSRRPPLARRAYTWCANAQYPDAAMGWIVPAYRNAARRMARVKYDAVISSGYPFSSHVIAYALALRFGVPWIADYRDLWSGNPYCTDSAARQAFTRHVERFLIRRAGRITAVSPALVADLRELHRRDDVIAISNGSSEEEWADIPLVAPREFNILYAGNLYGGLRSPDLLFAAAATLRNAGDPAGRAVRFDFYTGETGVVSESAHRYGIADAVRTHAVVPRVEVLRRQREAAGLAIVLRNASHVASEFGSKIFEYLGAGRPIIATGPPGSVVEDLLERSGAGYFVHDTAAAASALQRMYAQYRAGNVAVTVKPGFRPFTAADLAQRFAAELDALSSRT
jgi:glycosyltransferase involved in cell wall biosynthesis